MNKKIELDTKITNLVEENKKLNKQVNTIKTIQHSVSTKLEIKKVIDVIDIDVIE